VGELARRALCSGPGSIAETCLEILEGMALDDEEASGSLEDLLGGINLFIDFLECLLILPDGSTVDGVEVELLSLEALTVEVLLRVVALRGIVPCAAVVPAEVVLLVVVTINRIVLAAVALGRVPCKEASDAEKTLQVKRLGSSLPLEAFVDAVAHIPSEGVSAVLP